MAILFVDDDTTGRMAAAYHLRRAGFEVDETADGEAALGRFDPLRHALVITDLRMPGGGGDAVLRGVRERAPDVPVIVITAYGSVERAVNAVRDGAWDFLEKPFGRSTDP